MSTICQVYPYPSNNGYSWLVRDSNPHILQAINYMSNEKNSACFGYKGDNTIQLYEDHNKPL